MENKTKETPGTAKLEIEGKTYELPVLSGTHGPQCRGLFARCR